MRSAFLALLLAFTFSSTTQAQVYEWVQSAGGPGSDYGFAVVVDKQGFTYVGGTASDSSRFGRQIILLPDAPHPASRPVIAKFDTQGRHVWATAFGDTSGTIWSVAQHAGTVYAVGEGVVAAVDTSGTLKWQLNLTRNATFTRVLAGDDGYIYVSGYFERTLALPDTTLRAKAGNDILLLKISATGQIVAYKIWGSEQNDEFTDFEFTRDGNIIASMNIDKAIDFDTTTLEGGSYVDMYLLWFDRNFDMVKVHSFPANYEETARQIAVDREGAIYLSGLTTEGMLWGSNWVPKGAFLAKLASDGTPIWAKWGMSMSWIRGIEIDSANRPILHGYVSGDRVFDSVFAQNMYESYALARVSPATGKLEQLKLTHVVEGLAVGPDAYYTTGTANSDFSFDGIPIAEPTSAMYVAKIVSAYTPLATRQVMLISPEYMENVAGKEATLVWDSQPNATRYELQFSYYSDFRKQGLLHDSLVIDTTYRVKNLVNGTTYYWRIRPIANPYERGLWTEIRPFVARAASVDEDESVNQLVISPNPANHFITFNTAEKASISVTIVDMIGRAVLTEQVMSREQVQLGSLPNGLYTVVVTTADGTSRSSQLVISR
jgi:hypothetical protein